MADHWQSRMWHGLMQWVEDEQYVERRRVVAEQARLKIGELLAEDHLGKLTLDEFNEYVWRFGAIKTADGDVIAEEQYRDHAVEEIRERLASGEWSVEGNQMVGQATSAYGVNLAARDDELRTLLLDALRGLLYGGEDLFDAAASVIRARNGLGPNAVTMILAMLHPDTMSLHNAASIAGARKLAWLLGTEDEWEELIAGDYRAFTELMQEVRDHSGGVLRDMLMVDAFLYRISELREPQHWKVALAMGEPEGAELQRRAVAQGFAAVKGGEPDANDEAFREIQVGDYVVMHRDGCIGGVGRVTRPYYEIDVDAADEVDARCHRRIGVDWLAGESSCGDALAGATLRRTVIDLDEGTFWRLAAEYANDPRFEEVLNPPENWRELAGLSQARAWIFQGNPDLWDFEQMLARETPFRENWTASRYRDQMQIGDTVYLWQSGERAGLYAVAKIISSEFETADDPYGKWKVNLVVERVLDRPLLRSEAASDERLADLEILRQPQGSNFRVTPEQDIALREVLGLPSERYYLLVSADDREEQRQGTGYSYWLRARGVSQELTDDVLSGSAVHYLLYHTGPRYELSSFGLVEGIDPPEGPTHDDRALLALQNARFEPPLNLKDEGAHEWMRRTELLAEGLRFFQKQLSIISVFPRDYYTIVGAGLGALVPGAVGPTIHETAHACCCAPSFIEGIVAQLRRKGQVIFYGPPGTGKTFVARQIAEYLTDGDDSRQELIQFHPSYTYEDFMEGIKPESFDCGDGRHEVSYPVRAGSFMRFCERASQDPESTYVFIIDEINRGQIAKIFGELMYLLEYRDDAIQLAYTKSEGDDSRQRFRIPGNVLIIGTMNTADRSIALVDFALRRRFTFIPFYPNDAGPVQGMLRTWLEREAPQTAWLAGLVDDLNRRLLEHMGRDFLVGHSYFMCDDLCEDLVREVWTYQIEPLLHEYFVGHDDRLKAYDLAHLIATAQGQESTAEKDAGSQAAVDEEQ